MEETPFTKLMDLQKGLLPVLEAAGSSTNLALDFKRAEMKIGDLNILVQQSDLEDKDTISRSLSDFEALTATASRHLSRMESNIEGVVTTLLVTDDHVIRILEHIEHDKQQKSVISATTSAFVPYPSPRPKLIEAFIYMANLMESEIEKLSGIAATLTLDKLRLNMRSIHSLVSKVQGKTADDLERTLAYLWTIVGGNRAKLAKYAGHHSLLSQIGNHHSVATSKVSQALVELQRLEYDLKRLRDRLETTTTTLPNDPDMPLEYHIEYLRKGVEVLTEGRFRAKRKEDEVIEQIGNRKRYPRLRST